MDYYKALEILEIDISKMNITDINMKKLKKKYHKLALQHHPDKNGNTTESNEKFKKIQEAYEYLKNEMKIIDDDMDSDSSTDSDKDTNTFASFTSNFKTTTTPLYIDILKLFMKSILEGKYNEIISRIVGEIVAGCKKISLKLFDDLDKDTCMSIYTFLSKNRNILHINESILEGVREIVQQKFQNVLIYKLNPNINDLINNNIYKLNINDQICYVPLWIAESYFDISGCEIITICEPELSDNITIDEDNNIHIEIKVSLSEELSILIMNDLNLTIQIANKTFEIPIQELNMKKEQLYTLKNKGIYRVQDSICDNIFDEVNISEKADIIVKIKLT
jgi:hypothetical protein